MTYAIRYYGPLSHGTLVELTSREAKRIVAKQDAEDALRDAWWESDEATRPAEEPPVTYPYYEVVRADQAHRWVRDDLVHETLLYTEDGRIRRA